MLHWKVKEETAELEFVWSRKKDKVNDQRPMLVTVKCSNCKEVFARVNYYGYFNEEEAHTHARKRYSRYRYCYHCGIKLHKKQKI